MQNSPLVSRRSCPAQYRSERGVAIVIVLAFVVLVSGLVVAFFSRSVQDRQVSSNSANETRVELFAQGAMETTLGDLKQEIIDGSVNLNPDGPSVYFPRASSAAMPCLVASSGTNGLNNLLKLSTNDFFYSGAGYAKNGVKRAAAGPDALTTTPSLNGRRMTKARWNKPLLMEPVSESELEPKGSFTAPSWILVTRSGSNPSSPNKDVVGRYAYAIYNEGGLLDANVAGYPSSVGEIAPEGGIGVGDDQTVFKTATTYADLTQLELKKEQVEKLVAWRNYATLKAGGGIPPNAKTSAAFFSLTNRNETGFLKTGTALEGNQTDRMFVGRQQLLKFMQSEMGLSATHQAFQCISAFSRTLNQPSYAPDPARVRVSGSSFPGSGNSANNLDDVYNPVFRKIRVREAFTRNDGTMAIVGEPLVKRRFALNRLCWITCEGPSAGASDELKQAYVSQGIPRDLLGDGTPENIYAYFGLSWTGPNGDSENGRGGFWTYHHGVDNSVASLEDSLAGSDVIRKKREPDFFELLKAAVTVGAVAKSSTSITLPPQIESYERVHQSRVNNEIIQIGANIIDQSAPDRFPTRIVFRDDITTRSFYGVDDLPYFYGVVIQNVIARHSNPKATVNNNGEVTQGPIPHNQPLLDGGLVVALASPIIWNPHQLASTPTNMGPTEFRLWASNNTIAWGFAESSQSTKQRIRPFFITSSGSTFVNPVVVPWPDGNYRRSTERIELPTNETSTVLLFSGTNASLYREPTPLLRPGVPQGSDLRIPTGNLLSKYGEFGVTEAEGGLTYVGMFMGEFPLRQTEPSNALMGTGTITTAQRFFFGSPIPGSNTNYGSTFSIEYKEGDQWIPYQQRMVQFRAEPAKIIYPRWLDRWGNNVSFLFWDPRTRRWTAQGNSWTSMMKWIDADKTMKESARPGTDLGVTAHSYRSGGLSKDMYDGFNYRSDVDGVVRRPMGAWVPGGTIASTTVGLPMATAEGKPENIHNRPIMLHRPFRSVAELGYVLSDTPWRNLNFSTPESGFTALLDLFCINEGASEALVAGKVDLNTRQPQVLKAILSGARRDEQRRLQNLSPAESDSIAQALIAWSSSSESGKGPLSNIAELVGRYGSDFSNGAIPPAPPQPYDGFSRDLGDRYSAGAEKKLVGHFRETAIRALSDTGQAGTWNLLIDLVAQVGRYPSPDQGLDDFVVEGEKRYWLHVAIDRQTAEVIDQHLELVNE